MHTNWEFSPKIGENKFLFTHGNGSNFQLQFEGSDGPDVQLKNVATVCYLDNHHSKRWSKMIHIIDLMVANLIVIKSCCPKVVCKRTKV